jgi:hypothetical protein
MARKAGQEEAQLLEMVRALKGQMRFTGTEKRSMGRTSKGVLALVNMPARLLRPASRRTCSTPSRRALRKPRPR